MSDVGRGDPVFDARWRERLFEKFLEATDTVADSDVAAEQIATIVVVIPVVPTPKTESSSLLGRSCPTLAGASRPLTSARYSPKSGSRNPDHAGCIGHVYKTRLVGVVVGHFIPANRLCHSSHCLTQDQYFSSLAEYIVSDRCVTGGHS